MIIQCLAICIIHLQSLTLWRKVMSLLPSPSMSLMNIHVLKFIYTGKPWWCSKSLIRMFNLYWCRYYQDTAKATFIRVHTANKIKVWVEKTFQKYICQIFCWGNLQSSSPACLRYTSFLYSRIKKVEVWAGIFGRKEEGNLLCLYFCFIFYEKWFSKPWLFVLSVTRTHTHSQAILIIFSVSCFINVHVSLFAA